MASLGIEADGLGKWSAAIRKGCLYIYKSSYSPSSEPKRYGLSSSVTAIYVHIVLQEIFFPKDKVPMIIT